MDISHDPTVCIRKLILQNKKDGNPTTLGYGAPSFVNLFEPKHGTAAVLLLYQNTLKRIGVSVSIRAASRHVAYGLQ